MAGVVRTCVVVVTLLAASAAVAEAHTGGHALSVGAPLHVFTSPSTGDAVPGTIHHVSGAAVYVEDVGGRLLTWPIAALTPADRAEAERFRAKVDALHRVPPPTTPARPWNPEWTVPWPALWLSALIAALALTLARARLSTAGLARITAAAFAVALPLACASSASTMAPTSPTSTAIDRITLPQASYFSVFPTRVRIRQDSTNLYVESDGLAEHTMMKGIRSWQQQVPLPQPYTGTNAFTIPLTPTLAATPISARTALFNGAIALAINGVPIFNALNNRGDDAFLFGELDEYGGHSGRADDYHYHAAPLFLSSAAGATRPVAVALDGFPIFGNMEPDGSAVRPLDEWNGHADPTTLYHYHGTRTYPYINGGMRGVVRVVSDHIDPQPSLRPLRPAGTPLNGATISAFASTGPNAWRLEYLLNGGTWRVDYRIDGAVYTFVFTDPSGASRTETYTR